MVKHVLAQLSARTAQPTNQRRDRSCRQEMGARFRFWGLQRSGRAVVATPSQRPSDGPSDGPTDRWTNQPTNQLTSQPTNQPTHPPTNQPINQPKPGAKIHLFGPKIAVIFHGLSRAGLFLVFSEKKSCAFISKKHGPRFARF